MKKKKSLSPMLFLVALVAAVSSSIATLGISHMNTQVFAKQLPTGTLSDVEVVWTTAPEFDGINEEASNTAVVNCPTGKIALGGGVSAAGGTWPYENHPIGPDITSPSFGTSGSALSATGWKVRGNNGVFTGPLTAYAICAKVN